LEDRVTASNGKSARRWLAVVVAAYVIGNAAAFIASGLLMNADLRFAPLVPLLYLAVPLTALLISMKAKLLSKGSRLRGITVAVLAWCLVTWLAVLYIYLMNMYSATF
jgi:hypothetical protein